MSTKFLPASTPGAFSVKSLTPSTCEERVAMNGDLAASGVSIDPSNGCDSPTSGSDAFRAGFDPTSARCRLHRGVCSPNPPSV